MFTFLSTLKNGMKFIEIKLRDLVNRKPVPVNNLKTKKACFLKKYTQTVLNTANTTGFNTSSNL